MSVPPPSECSLSCARIRQPGEKSREDHRPGGGDIGSLHDGGRHSLACWLMARMCGVPNELLLRRKGCKHLPGGKLGVSIQYPCFRGVGAFSFLSVP